MLNIQFSMAELQNRCVDQGVGASDTATVAFTDTGVSIHGGTSKMDGLFGTIPI